MARLAFIGLVLLSPYRCAPPFGIGGPLPQGNYQLQLPPGFPMPVIPEDNPLTAEKVALGRHLFYDKRLSGNGAQACASCHQREFGFSERRTTSMGSTGEVTNRNAPGLANAVYYSTYTWSSKLLTEFEQQMLIPMFGEDPVELGLTGHDDEVLSRIRDDDRYRALFASAYPNVQNPVNFDNVVKAIACFL